MSMINVPPALKQQVQTILAERKSAFQYFNKELTAEDCSNDPKVNPRLGVGVAIETTLKILAPELFEQVLAVVQGRA